MKKVLVSLLVFSLIFVSGCGKKNEKDNSTNNQKQTEKTSDETTTEPTIEDKIENVTVEKQGDFLVKDVRIEERGAESVVTGNITNDGASTKSVTVVMKMINRTSSRLYGIVNVDVDDINPGESRDFSLSMVGDYSDVDFFEVTVNEK